MDCLFCKIIAGEIPSDKVFENENVLAFRDIAPAAPTHILIVPKAHIGDAGDITEQNSAVVAEMLVVAAKIAEQLGFAHDFRLVSNCGEDAGQSVQHLHFHLLSGRKFAWPPG